MELALNVDYYANHPFICTKIVENQEHHHQNLIFGLTISLSASNDWSKGKESKEFCLIREVIRNMKKINGEPLYVYVHSVKFTANHFVPLFIF